jgi:acyl-CoA synthetase (AMP-forming)/AMP-acid ligase II
MTDGIWGTRTFTELLARRAVATPDAPMLYDERDRRITFGAVAAWVDRVAAGLHDLGVREGTPVAWQLPTRAETVILSLALSRLGAVQSPIIALYRDREVGFVIRQSRAEFVFVPGTWRGFDYPAMIQRLTLDHQPQVVVTGDEMPEGDPATLPSPPPGVDREDAPVRWVYYTSGTTSDPKGVLHTDGTLLAGGEAMAKVLPMGPDDVGSIAFPFAHIAGPDYIVAMLVQGFPSLLLEAFALPDVIPFYNKYRVTMAGGSTAFYVALLNEQRKQPGRKLIPSLRVMSGGGAAKPPEIYFEAKAEMGCVVQHGYAMTESPMTAFNPPDATEEQLAYSEGPAVPGCHIDVVRPDGTDAAVGEEGEVRVWGTMLFKGYSDRSLDAEAFDEKGRYRTGDLGSLRADGFLNITGRLKDIIIRKGENISARDVEDALYAHPKVGDVVVIGLPDRERGERVCAVVEPAPGAAPLTFDEMVQWCLDAGLMRQKVPEQLVVQADLPRNMSLNKVLKYKLRESLAEVPWP